MTLYNCKTRIKVTPSNFWFILSRSASNLRIHGPWVPALFVGLGLGCLGGGGQQQQRAEEVAHAATGLSTGAWNCLTLTGLSGKIYFEIKRSV